MKTFFNTGKIWFFVLFICSFSPATSAEMDWASFTLDNDLFVGEDNGYTNGFYVSVYDTGEPENKFAEHDFWVTPLMWTISSESSQAAINAYTFGQSMNTPRDISTKKPGKDELPYSALLALTNSYINVYPSHSDRISTTLGVVGPMALGKEAQALVHKLIGSDEPKGWDSQLNNELVFQFSRARAWRSWVSENNHFDIVTHANIGLGTIQSAVNGGVVARYGRQLLSSYPSLLLDYARTSNPIAINKGWYIYSELQAGYIFNQIFTDGNTFRESRSVEYDHDFIGVSAGLAYSTDVYSITIAINNSNITENKTRNRALKNLTKYGTLTFAWKI